MIRNILSTVLNTFLSRTPELGLLADLNGIQDETQNARGLQFFFFFLLKLRTCILQEV